MKTRKSLTYNPGNGTDRTNEEGAIQLSEIIVSGIRQWTDEVIENPTRRGLEEALTTLSSRYYDRLTMGNGHRGLEEFLYKLELSCGRAAS